MFIDTLLRADAAAMAGERLRDPDGDAIRIAAEREKTSG